MQEHDENIVSFPGAGQGKAAAGSTAVAVAIVLGKAMVKCVQTAVPVAILLLAAIGLLRFWGY